MKYYVDIRPVERDDWYRFTQEPFDLEAEAQAHIDRIREEHPDTFQGDRFRVSAMSDRGWMLQELYRYKCKEAFRFFSAIATDAQVEDAFHNLQPSPP